MKNSRIVAVIILVAAAVIGITAIIVSQSRQEASVTGALGVSTAVPIGGPFQMADHTGRAVDQTLLQGRYSLIYFGYTFCPDVCPTELQDMSVALDLVGQGSDKVTPIFVTVDPGRDGQSQMADYVEAFHPRMIGLRGTEAQTTVMAKAFRVYYAPVDKKEGEDYYLMDHSNFIYLMGPDGQNIAIFNGDVAPEVMAQGIREAVGG